MWEFVPVKFESNEIILMHNLAAYLRFLFYSIEAPEANLIAGKKLLQNWIEHIEINTDHISTTYH